MKMIGFQSADDRSVSLMGAGYKCHQLSLNLAQSHHLNGLKDRLLRGGLAPYEG